MSTGKAVGSELMSAAEAFDAELTRFASLAESARKGPLNSQKNIERAARMFEAVGEAEKRLGVAAQELVMALTAARQRQEQHALAIQVRAQEIEQRTIAAAALLERYGALGEKAALLNQDVQLIAANETNGARLSTEALLPALAQLHTRMNEVAEGASLLVASAHEAEFDDIAGSADSLRQQLGSAAKKIGALQKSLASESPRPT